MSTVRHGHGCELVGGRARGAARDSISIPIRARVDRDEGAAMFEGLASEVAFSVSVATAAGSFTSASRSTTSGSYPVWRRSPGPAYQLPNAAATCSSTASGRPGRCEGVGDVGWNGQ